MSEVTVFGVPQSTYTRTVRMVCVEKGVEYTLEPTRPGTPDNLARHPFGKIPTLKHGDVELYETSAIARYVDAVFDGPALIPSDPVAAATMESWISTINSYLYDPMIRNFVIEHVFPSGPDGQIDQAKIDGALPKIDQGLAQIDAALEGNDWIAGPNLSIADLFLAPIMAYLSQFPPSKELMTKRPNIGRVGPAMEARPSFQTTAP